MAKNKSLSRQKAEIKALESMVEHLTAFAKTKAVIFKRAHELSITTGAEVGLLIFSPSGKPYTYGSPHNFNAIADRFLKQKLYDSENHYSDVVESNSNKEFERLMIQKEKLEKLLDIIQEIQNRSTTGNSIALHPSSSEEHCVMNDLTVVGDLDDEETSAAD
ncbi:PREDICTED: agamous-like MADS-box protein AGL29 [Nicotiana attenuata]|uniref:Agamous-like mads-box protein agl29 n=1 Tax=Nicotiana attenuata TaxID=49451 RepID=A0A314L9X3_NICAT|nr:PREDICTED: agamous-like MADS-box protein AGL29 [Nicotiana attenuata]OIT38382.1 agamous-like mads-box protein agl29 [Nicotiana attenuata]